MATGQDADNEDRTEDASEERRQEFREKGDVAISREVTAVFVLAALTGVMGFYFVYLSDSLQQMMKNHFSKFDLSTLNEKSILDFFGRVGLETFILIVPLFIVVMVTSTALTFAQTRLNWSWKRVAPQFNRMNPISGLARMVSKDSAMEVLKSVGKLIVVIWMAIVVLRGEMRHVPELMSMPIDRIWAYWGKITSLLFWSIAGLLLFVAALDLIYSFLSYEKKLKMTKEEVKEEYKKRESDPHMKSKMKRMQREIAMSKTIQSTKTATVIITNPTHFAVALRYELGMPAPIVVAKGQDLVAQRMKEVAKESDIPIMENKPLARALFKVCKVGQEIPESLYKAVSEIIRYVFMLKGRSLSRKK